MLMWFRSAFQRLRTQATSRRAHENDGDLGVWDSLVCVAQYSCFIQFFRTYVIDLTGTAGPSMLPTLSTGDLVLHEQLTPLAKLQRGDVIICRSPTDVDTQICKRIVGLPGETVKDAPKSAWGRSEVCHITLNKFTLRQLIYSSLPL